MASMTQAPVPPTIRRSPSHNIYTVLAAVSALVLLLGVIYVAWANCRLTNTANPLTLVRLQDITGR